MDDASSLGHVLSEHGAGLLSLTLGNGEDGLVSVPAGIAELGDSLSFSSYAGLTPFGSNVGCR